MRALCLLFLLIGCSRVPPRDAAWERSAASMEGHWVVRFDYPDRSIVTGSIELTRNRIIDRVYPRIGLATNYGTYAVAFRDLGGPPSGTRVPAIVAGVADDSVYVLFETDRKAFSMQMRGQLTRDSIRGVWSAGQAHGTIAGGTFLMTRK